MSLPAVLGPGLVSIYGYGSNASTLTGMVAPDSSFFFGIVANTWNSLTSNVSVGQSVMFQDKDVFTRLFYGGDVYTLLPDTKVILIETPLP